MSQRILFVSLFNDVGSDRIVAAMGRFGACCAVMAARDAFAARSRFVDRVFTLPRLGGYWRRRLFLGARLARVARVWRPDLVIPLDELSALALRDARLYRKASAEVRALLERSLGDPAGFEVARSRHRLVDMADALGIATPPQHAIDTPADAERVAAALGYPVVLKREQTCGGAGVVIIDGPEPLAAAYKRCAFKAATKRRMQRLIGIAASADDSPVVLQGHIAGRLAFRVVACASGKVLDGMSLLSERVHPAVTGASTILRPLERADMDAAAEKLVAALGCSGLVSLDFILPPEGAAVLIEMNPRPVASGHLGRLYGHDVYAALLAAHDGRTPAAPTAAAAGPEIVALFPRELDRDPTSALVTPQPGVLHDLPVDDPGVVAAYAGWLEERHPAHRARLRHLLEEPRGARPPAPSERPGARRHDWLTAAAAERLGKVLAHLQGPRLVK